MDIFVHCRGNQADIFGIGRFFDLLGLLEQGGEIRQNHVPDNFRWDKGGIRFGDGSVLNERTERCMVISENTGR